jgi:iron complex transport system substrate-binding protein
MPRPLLRLLVILALLLSGTCRPVWADAPERIVSLAPAMTETLFALGLGDKVVGITSVCDRPEEAQGRTRVGGMSNPSLEAILALKPELVVMTTDGNPKHIADHLQRFGVAIHVFTPRRLSEIPGGVRELGARVGAEAAADTLARELEQLLDAPPRFAAGEGPKALFVIWPEPLIVAGPGTLIDDALGLVGYVNIAADAGTAYPRFSVEEALRRRPDVIFLGLGHDRDNPRTQRLLRRLVPPGAAQSGRIVSVGDALYRAGPRLPGGIVEISPGQGFDTERAAR